MVIGKQKGMDLTFLTIMAINDKGYFFTSNERIQNEKGHGIDQGDS